MKNKEQKVDSRDERFIKELFKDLRMGRKPNPDTRRQRLEDGTDIMELIDEKIICY